MLAIQQTELAAALEEWSRALGTQHVIADPTILARSGRATFATSHAIQAILRPAGRAEVQQCLRIANRRGIAVYPVSGGLNWGYGSKAPTADSVLLDLRRMDRIVDFSEDLAYVTVEPGVTQGQLYQFLQERRSRLWLDVTGASPEASVIGNTVERGFGHTPYGDHFAHVCGLEVVLPEGEVVETGFGSFPGAKAAPVYRWGLGPALDGLFSQSNLGVVTRMTTWLMPAPDYFQAFYFRTDTEDGLAAIIDALRPLRLNGTLRSTVHIGNDYKVISALQRYPWEEMGGRTPLAGPLMPALRHKLQIGVWNGSGGLYGTRAQVAEARRLLKRALGKHASKLQFLDDRKLRLAGYFAKAYGYIAGWDLSAALELIRPVYGLMKGIPTKHPLESTYWRKRMPIPADMDPDRDGCGLLWCSPICPADGRNARALTDLACRVVLEDGFEPMISISLVTDRTLACVISISYDRDVPGEDERAMACHSRLLHTMIESGYPTYRLGVQSMSVMRGDTTYHRLRRSLKTMLDPNGILAPGRYDP